MRSQKCKFELWRLMRKINCEEVYLEGNEHTENAVASL